MSEEVATLKVPVFNGKEKNFQSWWIRFQAYARVKQFSTALTLHADLPTTEAEIGTLDPTNDDEKRQISAGKRNVLAMAHLTMALGTEALLNKVVSVSTTEWPGGLAYELIALLKEEYQPKDRIASVEMKQKLARVSMKSSDKPTVLFEQIKAIENQYSGLTKTMDEEDKIVVVLEKAPVEYAEIFATTENKEGSGLTLKHLEDAMKSQYRIKYGNKNNGKAGNGEFTLSAFNGKC